MRKGLLGVEEAAPNPSPLRGGPMSQENVDALKAMYEAFDKGDIAAVLSKLHDDATWDVPASIAAGGVYRGPDGVGAFFTELAGTYPSVAVVREHIHDAGDVIVMEGRIKFTLPGGDNLEVRSAHFWTFR